MKSLNRIYCISISLLILVFSEAIFADSISNIPPGSYSLTCSNIGIVNDTLSANCVKLNGSTQKTSLSNLSTCMNSITKNGEIGNIDGNLICLPDLPASVPDFVFPASETTINQWIYSGDQVSLINHSWGIWASLTQYVGVINGVSVRAFETWATPSNMIYQINSNVRGQLLFEANQKNLRLLDLDKPAQFKNNKKIIEKHKLKTKLESDNDGDTSILVGVGYNPPAANHAISNKLFLKSTLDQYLANGYSEIPNFPNNAITIKPVYKIVPHNSPNGIYKMPGWPGTPTVAKPFPEEDWNSCIYIDVKGTGVGGNSIDEGCKGKKVSNTFYLENFIHQKINAEDATYLSQQVGQKVTVGDYVILVGMHVTTREIKRWAWQTFWWSADATKPFLPSSSEIAAARPLQYLDNASKHYAMSVAYQMVSPAQPITGGKSVGTSVIAYNPHLEAGFSEDVFQVTRPIAAKETVKNKFGVQTNCMSCHNLALYNPKTDYNIDNGSNRQRPYGADFYMAIDDPIFSKSLKLDFAWSILGSMVDDTKSK